jgi:hypothetical protein
MWLDLDARRSSLGCRSLLRQQQRLERGRGNAPHAWWAVEGDGDRKNSGCSNEPEMMALIVLQRIPRARRGVYRIRRTGGETDEEGALVV